jgi:hypothetical protein|nr:MAG TPA: hypothetical protein [Caudoviricetes sp.]
MSIETERKLLKLIEEYREKAQEHEKGSQAQVMYASYADGIRRAVSEIKNREEGHERKIL